jgi:hypothetical protein
MAGKAFDGNAARRSVADAQRMDGLRCRIPALEVSPAEPAQQDVGLVEYDAVGLPAIRDRGARLSDGEPSRHSWTTSRRATSPTSG